MSSTIPSHGYFSIGKHLLGLTTFLLTIAASAVFSPASGGAADRSATAEKRITAIANDPAIATEPVGASAADGRSAAGPVMPGTAARSRAIDAIRKAPLGFIDNRGQADARAAFYARRGNATFWLTRDGVVFDLARNATRAAAPAVRPVSADGSDLAAMAHGQWERAVVTESFVDASSAMKLDPQMELPTSYGYIHGADSSRWLAGVKSYRLIAYRGIWKGIDLRLYGVGRDLEQEFVVAPGADAGAIRMSLSGARAARIASDGALVIDTPAGQMRLLPPFAYQHVDGRRIAVAARFTIDGANRFGFALGSYRHERPLVIDPPVLYATYLGGIHDDEGQSIAVDPAGNSYVAGFTASEDFPVSATAFQLKRANLGVYVYNAFVTKLSPSGVIIYSTFVGGSGNKGGSCGDNFPGDCAQRIAVDAAGNAYVTGTTSSADFPTTGNAYQPAFGGGSSDAFLFELSPDGSHLAYSTFLGGSANEGALGIAADGSGDVWIGGEVHGTGTFPSTSLAFQKKIRGADNGFVAKFDLTRSGASSLVWATLLGGTSPAVYGGVLGLTVDATGRVFVAGQTHSTDYPTTAAALQRTFTLSGGCLGNGNPPFSAAFVSELSRDGSGLLYSTYVGGTTVAGNQCDQFATAIALDSAGNIWSIGGTGSSSFPTTPNAYSQAYSGGHADIFLHEISADGTSQLYGSYFGGSGDDFSTFGMALDDQGDVYFGGVSTSSADYPLKNSTQAYGGGGDAVLSEIHPDAGGTTLVFSTFLGGSGSDVGLGLALDGQGNLHFSGATASLNFPVVNAIQTQYANGDMVPPGDFGPDRSDAFVAEYGLGLIGSVTPGSGGNFGSTTVTIGGAGFESGATASLTSSGNPIASGQFVNVATDGASMRATFDLTSVTPGTYDVEVVNPDTTSFVAPAAFTVVAGGGAKLWVTLVGRSKIRVGTPSTFNLDYGNTGLNDAYFARVFVRFPTASLTYQLGATLTQPQITGNPIDVSATPPDVQIGGNTVVPLIIPVVPAGGSGSVPIIFTAPAVQSGIMLKTWVNPAGSASVAPVLSLTPQPPNSTSGTIALWSMPQCYADMAQYAAEAFGLSTPQQCWGVFPQNSQGAAANAVASIMNGNASLNSFLMSLTQFLDQQDKAVDQCLQMNGFPRPDLENLLDSTVTSIVNLVENTITKDDCKVAVEVDEDADDSADDDDSDSSTDGGGSIDPNDKTGPAGVTAARWVLNSQPLNYTVSFENEPAATLPAQQVVVIDKLDPAKVDLSTFRLGPMGFNRTVVAPPTSTNNYSATVDLRPGQDLLVQIQGSLNADTGVVKWTFRSLDPATNLPPADPSVGFLPPDTAPPAGDGFVVFSVLPKRRVANGTKIPNQALVVFDSNAPIKTPVWSNLVARPVAQALSITPASLVFRHVPIFGTSDGTSPPQTVTLTNPGPQPMVVAGVAASSDFLVKPTACRTVLGSGQSCTFGVRFRPADLGTTLGQLTISDNAAKAPQLVALKGIGVPGALTFTPTSLAFGKVKVNTTGPAKRLTMTNATNAHAMIVSVAPSAGFVTSNDHCTGVTLNPAQICTVGVAFSPTGSAGTVKGDLTVTTDAEAQEVPLSGDATP